MSSALLLSREFHELKKRPRSNYFQVYDLQDDNIHEWLIFVIGPPHTMYQGGVYKALMRFPDTYPMEPPSIQFLCNMYHPNIYRDGKVCISILQTASPDETRTEEFWRPVLGVEQAILSVVSLLSDPNNDDPANSEAASCLMDSPEKFTSQVQKYAKSSMQFVPSDFVYPVVAGTAPEPSIPETSTRRSIATDNSDEDEYVYSDDEWEDEMDDENESNNTTVKRQKSV